MSYCRNNGIDSDVYVVATGEGERSFWSCVGCSLAVPRITGQVEVRWTECGSRQEMLEHLLEHREQGDKVPQQALDRLGQEIKGESHGLD